MNIEKIIKEFDLKDLLFIPNRRWLVYILINKSEVVYIGKSDVSGYSRRLQSHKDKFTFTESRFIEVGESEQMALDVEKGLISACKPKHNTIHKDFCFRKINDMFKCLNIIRLGLPKEVIKEIELVKEVQVYVPQEVEVDRKLKGLYFPYKKMKKVRDLFFYYWLKASLLVLSFVLLNKSYIFLGLLFALPAPFIKKKRFREGIYKINPFSKYNTQNQIIKRLSKKYIEK